MSKVGSADRLACGRACRLVPLLVLLPLALHREACNEVPAVHVVGTRRNRRGTVPPADDLHTEGALRKAAVYRQA